MRSTWGQAPDDQGPLPGPDQGGPDWLKGHRHPDNIAVSLVQNALRNKVYD